MARISAVEAKKQVGCVDVLFLDVHKLGGFKGKIDSGSEAEKGVKAAASAPLPGGATPSGAPSVRHGQSSR